MYYILIYFTNKDAILIYNIYTIAFKNKNIIYISTQDLFALI